MAGEETALFGVPDCELRNGNVSGVEGVRRCAAERGADGAGASSLSKEHGKVWQILGARDLGIGLRADDETDGLADQFTRGGVVGDR